MKKIMPFVILAILVIILIIFVIHNKKIDIEENYTRIIKEVISDSEYKLSTEKYVFKNGKYTYTKEVTYSNNEEKNERESKSGNYKIENEKLYIDDEEWQIKEDKICEKDCDEAFYIDSVKDENIITKEVENIKTSYSKDESDSKDEALTSNNSNKIEDSNNEKETESTISKPSSTIGEGALIDITNLDDYKNIEDVTFIVIVQTGCSHCVTFKETMANIIAEYPVNFYLLNIAQINDSALINTLIDEYEVSGTPTTLIFKNGEFVDRRAGTMSKDSLKTLLKSYKKIS